MSSRTAAWVQLWVCLCLHSRVFLDSKIAIHPSQRVGKPYEVDLEPESILRLSVRDPSLECPSPAAY